jgi:hypothetical protein
MFLYWLLEGKGFRSRYSRLNVAVSRGCQWDARGQLGSLCKHRREDFHGSHSPHLGWQPVVAFAASAIAILMLIVLGLITVNLILVNCEMWIMLSAGLIFLGFGASEWTRVLLQTSAWRGNKTVRDAFAGFDRPEHHEFFVCRGTTDGLGCRCRGPGYGDQSAEPFSSITPDAFHLPGSTI